MLTDKRKTYEAVLHLGIETDTQDISGTIKQECPVQVTKEEVLVWKALWEIRCRSRLCIPL